MRGFPGGTYGKESACNAGDPGSIPKSGRFPGEGNGYTLQYSCPENSMAGGAWWDRVGHDWATNTHTHTHTHTHRRTWWGDSAMTHTRILCPSPIRHHLHRPILPRGWHHRPTAGTPLVGKDHGKTNPNEGFPSTESFKSISRHLHKPPSPWKSSFFSHSFHTQSHSTCPKTIIMKEKQGRSHAKETQPGSRNCVTVRRLVVTRPFEE